MYTCLSLTLVTLTNPSLPFIIYRYVRAPVVRHLHTVFRWNLVMCSTGPSLLTASAREVLLNHPDTSVRIASTDFRDYGGKFKAVSTRAGDVSDHYMRTLDKNRGMGTLRT